VICARIRVADTPDRFQVMAMSESSKRARAAVGDRRRSAPHAGWLLRLTAIRCSGSRSWPLPRWPALGPVARFGPVRRAGRGAAPAACVRGSDLRRFRSPARHAGHDQISTPATNLDPTRQNDFGTAVGRGPGRQRRRMYHLQ
jgi:hypothetical protein